MKALISPEELVKYISSWSGSNPKYTVVGQRICQVQETTFEVGEPMFWMDCTDNVKPSSLFYYDPSDNGIYQTPPDALQPQPVTQGTNNL